MIIEVNKENFEKEILKSDIPVLADFNAEWCGPCKMLKPVLDELASENKNFKIVSINVDDEDELAYKYDVSSIPCLVVFKGGEEVARSVGFKPKEEIESLVGEN
ncbi:MAG: thioredoxin [Clostridia bacterium]|nr:thioredoxin [Clostridia bacterium]